MKKYTHSLVEDLSMKKLLLALSLCTGISASSSTSKISSLSRLGLTGIFRHAQRPTAAAGRTITPASKLPFYTKEKMTVREFFPTQSSPKTAAVRNGMSAIQASLREFRNSFRTQYSDPLFPAQYSNFRRQEAARNRTLEERVTLLSLLSGVGKASAAA
jgi:hypothetical protein